MSSLLKRGTLALFATAALTLAGCATQKEAACCSDDAKKDDKAAMAGPKTAAVDTKPAGRIAVINTICPIGGDDFETKDRPAELARTVSGQNIGFCCDHCTAKFDKMSDEKKAQVLTAATANKQM